MDGTEMTVMWGTDTKKCILGARDGEARQGLHLSCLSLRKKEKTNNNKKLTGLNMYLG